MDIAKQKRTSALKAFTRNENAIKVMFDAGSPSQIVTAQFQKLQGCWDKLEDAQEAYIESITGAVDDATMNALDEPSTRYQAVVKSYSTFMKTFSEQDRAAELKTREEEETLSVQVCHFYSDVVYRRCCGGRVHEPSNH